METEVVVVGGGGSALAAAIEAAANGARVVLLEKNPELGGTTARSIGSISASRTPYQKRVGIVDSPQEHYEDMELFSKKYTTRTDNDVLRRILADNLPDTVQWLTSLGVEFFGPLEEKPHRKPRMHNVLPNSRAYIYHLERRARQLGVQILTNARARRFVTKDRQVIGVEFDQPDQTGKVVHASRGVVLASGDYSADPEMKRKLINESVAAFEPVNPTNTGDGQRMALELGAKILNGDFFSGGMRFIPPAKPSWLSKVPPMRWLMRPTSILLNRTPRSIVRRFVMGFLTTVLVPDPELHDEGAILVNSNGERFAEENKGIVYELAHQPGGIAYIVFDAQVAQKFSAWPHYVSTAPGFAYAYLSDYERSRPDLFHKGETLDALASSLGVDAGRFKATVAEYNASGDTAPPGSKAPPRGQRPTLSRAPYYALGPVKNYINFTDGGLVVDDQLRVLDGQGSPIPGLYAAGNAGQGGLLLKGHGHHIGWAMTSGRIAGRNAANRKRGSAG